MRELREAELKLVAGAGKPCHVPRPCNCSSSQSKANNGFGNGGDDGGFKSPSDR